jgi:hypothetical protein
MRLFMTTTTLVFALTAAGTSFTDARRAPPVRAGGRSVTGADGQASTTPGFAVDWDFVSSLEGGRRLDGYVPPSRRSGVTIATGVDLGQRSAAEIDRLSVGPALAAKLKPYARMKGSAARTYLRAHPLNLTGAQAASLDRAIRSSFLKRLSSLYRRAAAAHCAVRSFGGLPPEAQTVIASVAYQYGPDLARATPRFWRWVTQQEWDRAVAELEDFGDRYHARRAREAALLQRLGCAAPGAKPAVDR